MIFAHKPIRRRVAIAGHGLYSVEICAAGIRYRAFRSPKWLLLPHGVALTRAADLEGQVRTRRRKSSKRRRPAKLSTGI